MAICSAFGPASDWAPPVTATHRHHISLAAPCLATSPPAQPPPLLPLTGVKPAAGLPAAAQAQRHRRCVGKALGAAPADAGGNLGGRHEHAAAAVAVAHAGAALGGRQARRAAIAARTATAQRLRALRVLPFTAPCQPACVSSLGSACALQRGAATAGRPVGGSARALTSPPHPPAGLPQIGEITARMNKACHDQASTGGLHAASRPPAPSPPPLYALPPAHSPLARAAPPGQPSPGRRPVPPAAAHARSTSPLCSSWRS